MSCTERVLCVSYFELLADWRPERFASPLYQPGDVVSQCSPQQRPAGVGVATLRALESHCVIFSRFGMPPA